MDPKLAADILTGDSEEISELNANMAVLEGFVDLSRQLDALPDLDKRFYEESRSLYQATSRNRDIAAIEAMLSTFFGPPVKPAGKPLPRKLNKESTVTYLGGIQKDQSLFLLHLKTGTFYGALWPWRHNKNKIEIHMGYCSDWMSETDYQKLEEFFQRSLSRSALERMKTQVGGQIHGIGLPSFLQMAEMEQSSFTLRVTAMDKVGQLHVVGGRLTGARTGAKSGPDAAYHIISWENASIEIIPPVEYTGEEINQPLMHILMESLKLKDEKDGSGLPDPLPAKTRRSKEEGDAAEPRKPLVRLERAPEPRRSSTQNSALKKMALSFCVLIVLGAGAWVAWRFMGDQNAAALAEIMKQVEAAALPDQKLAILESHLTTTDNAALSEKLEAEIQKVRALVEDRDFEQLTVKVGSLPVSDTYEKTALAIYGDFLQKHPESRHAGQIQATIRKIKNILDQYYYEEPKNAAKLDLLQRLEVYRQYRDRFPGQAHQQEVDALINEISRGYLGFLRGQEAQCEKSRRWDPCIQRYDDFIRDFKDSPLAQEARTMRADMLAGRNVKQLNRSKPIADSEDQKAFNELDNYLAANPNTPRRKAIEQEMAQLQEKIKRQRQWFTVRDFATSTSNAMDERLRRLDDYLSANRSGPYAGEAQALKDQLENQNQLSERQRQTQMQQVEAQARMAREEENQLLQQKKSAQLRRQVESQLAGSARYRVNGDGTFTDLTTGSTWCLLDSFEELGHCVDYASALRYVQGVRLGGRTNWRLPTANELAAIYKQKPYFPSSGSEWYWTAEAYSKGYHSVADVVTSKPETVFERENRMQTECGAARAIHP